MTSRLRIWWQIYENQITVLSNIFHNLFNQSPSDFYVEAKKIFQTMKKNMSVKITHWLGTSLSIWLHTLVFLSAFGFRFFGYEWSGILLVLTTALSLEAIYLALFIQMTVNRQQERLKGVEQDVEDILEDTAELTEEEDEKT